MKKLGSIITIFLLTLALISPASATELFQKDLKYGTTNNSEVKKLQQYLKDKNYYSGPISGNYYSLTRTALMKLQKSYGLKQTGKFDSVTRNRLNKTLALMIEVEDRTKELEELQEAQRLAELDKIIKAQLAATQVVQQPVVEQPRTEPIQEPQTQPVQPVVQPTQPEQPTQPQPDLSNKKKAFVSINGSSNTKMNKQWTAVENAVGINFHTNRSLANLPDLSNIPQYQAKNLNFYINPQNYFKSTLRLYITLNNTESETNDFSCVKSGNKFWQGQAKTVDGSYENILTDYTDLSNNYMGQTLKFEITCTNADGTTSNDSINVNITNSQPQ